MPSVELTGQEWGQVMAILSTAPWRDANPLLMKIGQQLQGQTPNPNPPLNPQTGQMGDGASKEVGHE